MATLTSLQAEFLANVFRRDYRWLTDRLRRRVGCMHQAEDVASEAFAQLATSGQLAKVQEPRALLTTIAQRVLYDLWRRRDLERAYLDALALQPEAVHISPEERALLMEALLLVDRALDGLPPKARIAFLYSRLDGLSYEEIAQRLGVSVRMVGHYLADALACCYLAASAS